MVVHRCAFCSRSLRPKQIESPWCPGCLRTGLGLRDRLIQDLKRAEESGDKQKAKITLEEAMLLTRLFMLDPDTNQPLIRAVP